uniref:Uncharacterized protein n=1 Tax=Sphaerodactylus townsendi TaxID=933632 RepID=A0ACB8G5D5_9SAUR
MFRQLPAHRCNLTRDAILEHPAAFSPAGGFHSRHERCREESLKDVLKSPRYSGLRVTASREEPCSSVIRTLLSVIFSFKKKRKGYYICLHAANICLHAANICLHTAIELSETPNKPIPLAACLGPAPQHLWPSKGSSQTVLRINSTVKNCRSCAGQEMEMGERKESLYSQVILVETQQL